MWSAFAQFKKNADAGRVDGAGCEQAMSWAQRPAPMQ